MDLEQLFELAEEKKNARNIVQKPSNFFQMIIGQ